MEAHAAKREITVVGAGMGGLTVANILHEHGFEVVVYDADPSATHRHQGGMLNINEDTGQVALAKMGLLEKFREIVLEDGSATRILDKTGAVRLESAPDAPGESRPEVDRGSLRSLLLSTLPEGVVRWNAKVASIVRVPAGHEVTFSDGSKTTAAVLIGADGAWSKVRPLLTDATPVYSGVTFFEMRFRAATERHPVAARMVGQGLMFALSDERGLIGHREPNDELCIYAALKVPEDWANPSVTIERVRAHFEGWHEDFHVALSSHEEVLHPRPIHALPPDLVWDRCPGVTLVGDAAHLMSPFAGEGVNLAMTDGADLAQAILDHPGDIEAAFAAYEALMFPRAHESARASASGIAMAFEPSAPESMLRFFDEMQMQQGA